MNKSRLFGITGAMLVAALGLLVLASSRAEDARAASGPCDPADPGIDSSEFELLGLVNQARAGAFGVPPMQLSGPANRAAQWLAEAIEAGEANSHLDEYGRYWDQRLLDCGYPERSTFGSGETLALGATASAAFGSMWTPNDQHQSGIEAPVDWTCAGVGRAGSIWVVVVTKSSPSYPGCPEPVTGTEPPPPPPPPPGSSTATSSPTASATPTKTPTPTPTPTPSPVANYGAAIEVCPGWNLVTVPVTGPVEDIFDTAELRIAAIYRPNGEAWQRWAPGVPAYARNLSHAFAGDVLWIYGTTAACEEIPL